MNKKRSFSFILLALSLIQAIDAPSQPSRFSSLAAIAAANQNSEIVISGEHKTAVIAPFGNTIAIMTRNGVYFWNGETETVDREFNFLIKPTFFSTIGHQIDFSPDGSTFLTVISYIDSTGKTEKKRLDIWSVEEGKIIRTLGEEEDYIMDACFSHDGSYVYGTRNTRNDCFALKIWDAKTGQELHCYSSDKFLNDIVPSRDSNRLWTTASDRVKGDIREYDVETGTILRTLSGHHDYIDFLSMSADGKRLISSSIDGKAIVWDTSDGRIVATFNRPSNGDRPNALSADGTLAITSQSTSSSNSLTVWNVETGEAMHTLSVNPYVCLTSVFFAPDQLSFYAFGDRRYFKRFSVRTGKEIPFSFNAYSIFANFRYSQNGNQLYVVDRDWVKKLDARSLKVIDRVSLSTTTVYQCAVSPDGTYVAAQYSENRRVCLIFDANTGEIVRVLFGHNGDIQTIDFSPDGKRLLTTCMDGLARIWDVDAGKLLQTLRGGGDPISKIAFSPNGAYVITQSSRSYLWNADTGQLLYTFGPEHTGSGEIFFTPEGDYIVFCGKTISFVSTISYQTCFSLQPVARYVFSASITPDGKRLLYFDDARKIVLQDIETSKTIATFGHQESMNVFENLYGKIVFAPDGRSFAAYSSPEMILHAYEIDERLLETPVSSETPTETPTATPLAPTATPTIAPSPTSTLIPVPPSISLPWSNLEAQPVIVDARWHCQFQMVPHKNALFLNTSDYNGFYEFPAISPFLFSVKNPSSDYFEYSFPLPSYCNDAAIGEDNSIYLLKEDSVIVTSPLGVQSSFTLPPSESQQRKRVKACLIVRETNQIPNTEPGDLIILCNERNWLSELWKWSPTTKQLTVLLDSNQLPFNKLSDMCVGPDGLLYLLSSDSAKIYTLEMDGGLREFTHFAFPGNPEEIEYFPSDEAFYLLDYTPCKKGVVASDTLIRFGREGNEPPSSTIVSEDTLNGENGIKHMAVSYDGSSLFVFHDATRSIQRIQRVEGETPTQTPTPCDLSPTAAPTPIAGWYVLDGYGGVHTSRPDLPRPSLPYFENFDIVRDIEPDPLGRGWYAIDGYGGIHLSSPDLPRPSGLPYFWGFDIVRSLELRQEGENLLFYVLDGFGTIHTNDPNFEYGALPWFGSDCARDLEPNPHGEGWIVLDRWGVLYFSDSPYTDVPLNTRMAWNPIVKGFVRFADDRTVLIDGYGGRHTNPFYQAPDRGDETLNSLYFSGWDIIWDIEKTPD